ncbi:protoporphyrinogen/coproporphyrinogen oxidase [uncultured Jatrophihabitans sp.]|uniref:protoporphyrinogen/coproporphyrinogen oxidase n=1 Tax=uncultured Jatrophihabitans sp. TaxID=1610747 RepID=UPI0035CAE7AA
MPAQFKVDVLVIGAGPTGIGAAVQLQQSDVDHLVVEAAAEPGGMARSMHDKHGFTWDLGGHVIHSHFDCFDKAVATAGTPMRAVARNGYVWTGGALIPMPIQAQLSKLPTDLRPDLPSPNLASYYRNNFGSELARQFFEPHTFKMWAHPLEDLSHEWTSMRAGSGRRNVPPLGLAADQIRREQEFFPYPEGGTGRLWHDIVRTQVDGARLRLGASVVSLDAAAHRATLADGSVIDYEACISTAPITKLLEWAGPAGVLGPDSQGAPVDTARLVSSTVHAVGFGVRGDPPPELADKTYLASPDVDVPWYRASVLSNYDPGNAGDGRWSVLCEVSSSRWRPVSHEAAVAGSRASLERLGMNPAQIESTWSTQLPMGYPLPTQGRDEELRRIDAGLRSKAILSRGRFGGWRYESCNQDYSFAQGVEAVAHLLDGSPEDVYWHPERF